jgi:hypothetical protein
MLTTKQALLGLLVLGVLGMHGLVAGGCTTAAHHAWPTPADHHAETTASGPEALPGEHGPGDGSGDGRERSDGDARGGALVLCLALLLAFAVAVAGGRRTTWVSRADRATRRVRLPVARILPARSPVLGFTVMRC